MIRIFYLLFLCLAFATGMQAQVKVKGRVTDPNKEPLPGANVLVKGTVRGTAADFDGNYEIEVKSGEVLEFSSVGFKTKDHKITATKSTTLNVILEEDTKLLDDVVVVGYGTSTKKAMVSAVSSVKSDELKQVPIANVTQGLAGRSPGLVVKASAGLDNRSTITIRGGGTPMVVIDGVIRDYNDFANIAPEDIASISILKDASATAVYGARAANGILQVTTLRGKEGKTVIEYDHSFTLSQPSILPRKLDAYEWAVQRNLGRHNDGQPAAFTDAELQKILDGSDLANYSNTNWQKLLLKDFAEQYKHSLRVSGGKQGHEYLVSLGYLGKGSLYRSGRHTMDLTNFRVNQNFTIGENTGLKGFASIDGYLKEEEHPYTSTLSGYGGVFSLTLANRNPLEPAFNNHGLFYLNVPENPIADTSEEAGYTTGKYKQFNGMLGLEWALPWVKGLKAKTNFSYRYMYHGYKNWRKDPLRYDWDSTTPAATSKPELTSEMGLTTTYTAQNFLEYARQFNSHSLSLLGGYEASYTDYRNVFHKRVGYDFPIDQFGAGPKEDMDGGGSEYESGRAGFVGQVKYNFANRYFLEGSMRHDASDLFPKDKRWGTFFSGSLGWIVSDEFFMKYFKEKHIFDLLKFRASYGEVGLDTSIPRFSYIPSYNLNATGYVINGKYKQTFSEGAIPSPDITWYTTKQLNIGADFESFNNRLFGSLEYFIYKTTGYLIPADPIVSGYTSPLGKSLPLTPSDAEHRRAGWEAQLGWKGVIGTDFKYTISANITYFDALWAKSQLNWNSDNGYYVAEALEAKKNPYLRQTQQTGYYGTGYKATFYTDAQDVYSNPKRLNSFNITAGDLKYEDFNGDGQIDGADFTRIGKNSFPRANYGVNLGLEYKAWSVNMLVQGATRFDLYMGGALMGNNAKAGSTPYYDFQMDYWTPNNTNAKFPRLVSSNAVNGSNNVAGSDFWLINGAYVRLKDFSISYDLKREILKDYSWLSKLKLSLSGQNLFTISEANKYGMDPETTSSDFYGYPNERIYAIGVSVGF